MDQDMPQAPQLYVHQNGSDDNTHHLLAVYLHQELTPEHRAMIADLLKTLLPWIIKAVTEL